nr:MAG TPA: hypothetical protein [Caudoviricetes sp.]
MIEISEELFLRGQLLFLSSQSYIFHNIKPITIWNQW